MKKTFYKILWFIACVLFASTTAHAATTATPVTQGGTGINFSTGIQSGVLLYGAGKGALSTSTVLTTIGAGTSTLSGELYATALAAPYLSATSSAATSTFLGGITFPVFKLGSNIFSSLTGSGLTLSNGVLALTSNSVTINTLNQLSGGGALSLGGTLNLTISSSPSFFQASTTLLGATSTIYVGSTATTTIVGNNATSTFAGGIASTGAGGLSSTFGLTITGGSINDNVAATSTFTGALSFPALALGSQTISNFTGTGLALSNGVLSTSNIPNASLSFSSVTVTAGANLAGGGTVSLGSSITLNTAIAFGNLNVGALTATTTATSTFAGQLYASALFGPYLSASSTSATSTLQGTILAQSGGSVGIATTTPTGIFSVGNAIASGGFYILANGNLGQGTSSPSAGLTVANQNIVVGNGQLGQYVASTTGATTQSINWNSGNVQDILLQANTNFVINATSSNPIGGAYSLNICQGGAGSYTITFTDPQALRWAGITPATTTMGMGTRVGTGIQIVGVFSNNSRLYNMSSSTLTCK